MTDAQRWLLIISILIIGALIYILAPVLVPFVVAALLAYLFNPIVDWLTGWHLPRILAVIVVFLFIIFLVICLIFLIVPIIEQQVIILINNIPALDKWITTTILPWINKHFNLQASFDLNQMQSTLAKYLPTGSSFVVNIWKMASRSGLALISFFTNLILIPVVTFYLLCDWPKITSSISRLLPIHSEKDITYMVKECGTVLSSFFRGQLLVMICLGMIYAIGLWIVGLNVGILIGILAGLLSIVPYLGFISGLSLALLASVTQFHDWTHILMVLGVFCIGEIAESFILVPSLVGDRVGLHPVVIIFALLTGGKLFGFIGVLLAVPTSAVIVVLLRHLYLKLKIREL
jgi:predicted PurR-regulated permease PerM